MKASGPGLRWSRGLALLGIGLATLALAVERLLRGPWAWLPLLLALGWGLAFWLERRRSADVAFGGCVSLLAAGCWGRPVSYWLPLGMTAALVAWDLTHFCWRMRDAAAPERLERLHLRRLALVAGMGGALALLPQVIHRQALFPAGFPFGTALLLGGLTIGGLAFLLRNPG